MVSPFDVRGATVVLVGVLLLPACALDEVGSNAQDVKHGSGADATDSPRLVDECGIDQQFTQGFSCACPDTAPLNSFYSRDLVYAWPGSGQRKWYRLPEPDDLAKRWTLLNKTGDADLFIYTGCDLSPDCSSTTRLENAPDVCSSTGSIAEVVCVNGSDAPIPGHGVLGCSWEVLATYE